MSFLSVFRVCVRLARAVQDAQMVPAGWRLIAPGRRSDKGARPFFRMRGLCARRMTMLPDGGLLRPERVMRQQVKRHLKQCEWRDEGVRFEAGLSHVTKKGCPAFADAGTAVHGEERQDRQDAFVPGLSGFETKNSEEEVANLAEQWEKVLPVKERLLSSP